MRESIGEWFTLNIIIIFIVIVFGLLSATVSYYKAFKMNSSILYSIDKYEGYNGLSEAEIERNLETMGYIKGSIKCPKRGENFYSVNNSSNYPYCVYYIADDTPRSEINGEAEDKPLYYNYSVVTYIYVDLPLINNFKIPVYTKGERIFNFTDEQTYDENYGKNG